MGMFLSVKMILGHQYIRQHERVLFSTKGWVAKNDTWTSPNSE